MRHPALTPWGKRNEHRAGHVNVTPMIDVIMVLIVFYLIVGQLATQRRADVVPPVSVAGVGEVEGETDDPLTLTVVDGGVLMDGAEIGIDRLADALRGRIERGALNAVQVRAGESRSFGEVRPVLEACRDAGVARVRLATRRGELG